MVAYTKAGKKENWMFNILICGFEVISQVGPPLRVVYMRSSGEHKYLDVAAQFSTSSNYCPIVGYNIFE